MLWGDIFQSLSVFSRSSTSDVFVYVHILKESLGSCGTSTLTFCTRLERHEYILKGKLIIQNPSIWMRWVFSEICEDIFQKILQNKIVMPCFIFLYVFFTNKISIHNDFYLLSTHF